MRRAYVSVADRSPMRRGLKVSIQMSALAARMVADRSPMRRGLKDNHEQSFLISLPLSCRPLPDEEGTESPAARAAPEYVPGGLQTAPR